MKKILSNTYGIKSLTFSVAALLLPFVSHADIKYNLWDKRVIAATSIEELLLAILNIFIVVATPIIVLFIIYSGFLYVTARGDAEQTKKATRSLTYAIIGGVLIIGAVAIAAVIGNVIAEFQV